MPIRSCYPLVTASPDYMQSLSAEEQKRYFGRSLDFIKKRFSENSEQQSDLQIFELLRSTLFGIVDFNELNTDMLHRFMEKIEIKADGSPRIHYRFSDTSAFYLLMSIYKIPLYLHPTQTRILSFSLK